jgi:hypothetical protein
MEAENALRIGVTTPKTIAKAAALALACVLVTLATHARPAHAETNDHFLPNDFTLALPGHGEPSFVTFEMLIAEGSASDVAARAALVRQQMLAYFPGAVPVAEGEVSAQYLLKRYRWVDTHPTWAYNAAGRLAGLIGDAGAVQAAAESWGTLGANVRFTDAGTTTATPDACQGVTDGRNTVGWHSLPGNVLAMTCTNWSPSTGATEFDIQVDPNWAWTTEASFIRMDLQSVFTHEFGHALGIDHPCDINQVATCTTTDRNAVMYGGYAGGTNKRAQQPDDIAGLIAAYGATPGTDARASTTPTRPVPAAAQSPLPLTPGLTYRAAIVGLTRD